MYHKRFCFMGSGETCKNWFLTILNTTPVSPVHKFIFKILKVFVSFINNFSYTVVFFYLFSWIVSTFGALWIVNLLKAVTFCLHLLINKILSTWKSQNKFFSALSQWHKYIKDIYCCQATDLSLADKRLFSIGIFLPFYTEHTKNNTTVWK